MLNKPEHLKKIAYIKGILKNKYKNYNAVKAHIKLLSLYENKYDLNMIETNLKFGIFKNFNDFLNFK